uniref:HTH cro/C1-type domain-containing protein n=1 Tax=uncultured organism TaxID=155900 RepID=A0A7L9QBU7_9ZZZZ|nr:hypothetical protein [uncultured organism]
MTFLDHELAGLGEAPTGWARRNGITPTNLGKWRDGLDPTLESLEELAIALGRPMVDLLLAAGYITKADVAGRTVTPTPLPNVSDAIERDPQLSNAARAILRGALDLAQNAQPGMKPKRKTIKIE